MQEQNNERFIDSDVVHKKVYSDLTQLSKHKNSLLTGGFNSVTTYPDC